MPFLSHIMEVGVSRFFIPNIVENHAHFMSYINLKFQKGNGEYIFCSWDSPKLAGDSSATKPTIVKLNASNFAGWCVAKLRGIPENVMMFFSHKLISLYCQLRHATLSSNKIFKSVT